MELDKQFDKQFSEVVQLIQKARDKALKSVNTELVNLYWEVGKYINSKVESAEWGMGVIDNLADYLKGTMPGLKGFSPQNMWRMKQFYEAYKDYQKLSPLVRELSWSNNLHILSKTKSIEEKEFYLRLAIKERYTKRELERQIDSGYYERAMISKKKVSPVMTQIQQDMDNVFRDTYVLDFLNLPESYNESDLQKSIVANLRNFILEFGKDFAFIGQEYRLQIGKNDYFIDLLFFHRGLRCLVMIELKIDDFKPEYLGKLNFYLESLDRDVRKPDENPSVGIILCKSKDDEVVEYALSRNLSPALIAEYKTKLIPKEVLQKKLHEYYLLGESTTDRDVKGDSVNLIT
ncbi:MAG: PDDEXK nuclease domain-containing protein [Candidatus Desantisbacteria bacterium]